MKFQSFSHTFHGFMKGYVKSRCLLSAESVEFNCARVHLFPTETMQDSMGKTYPSEVLSHVRDEFPVYLSEEYKRMPSEERFEYNLIMRNQHECTQTPPEMVSGRVMEGYEQFISIIEQLDHKGIVSFRNLECPVQFTMAEKRLIDSFREVYGPDGRNERRKKRFTEKST
jgi:hypothetical protein